MPIQPRITLFLRFDQNAEEAVSHLRGIFPDSRIVRTVRSGDPGPGPKGSVLTIEFELVGQRLVALNGVPMFRFAEAISLAVNCETQQEIDRLWNALSAGGETSQCGWLKDKFGLSWQVVPSCWPDLMGGHDPARAQRARQAMMGMTKLDIAKLRQAADGP